MADDAERAAGDVPWDVIAGHLRAVRAGARRRAEPAARPSSPVVTGTGARWFRAHVSHLAARLPAGALAAAAWGGLQDSAPRSALLALHARVDGVTPSSWEDQSLVQVWFRWADHVVPRADAAVFTIGAAPRDARAADALDRLAGAVLQVLEGQPAAARDVLARMPRLPHPSYLRAAAVTGRVHLRWDASRIDLIPAAAPLVAPCDARVDLARRFAHWFAPAGPAGFSRWAGLSRADAEATWTELLPQLAPVAYNGKARWALTADVARLLDPTPPAGVRLLPPGDPLRWSAESSPPAPAPPAQRSPALTGRIVCAGEVVGAWGRVRRTVSVWVEAAAGREVRTAVEAEAHTLAAPLGGAIRLEWVR